MDRVAPGAGKRRLAWPHHRQPDLRRGGAAPIHRQSGPPRLSRGGSLSSAGRRILRRRGDRQRHFDLSDLEHRRGGGVRRCRADVQRPVAGAAVAGASLAGHPGAVRKPRTTVPTLARGHRRYGRDRASARGAVAKRAGRQARGRHRVLVDPPDRVIAHPARLRDCDPAGFVRARPFPPDPAWLQRAAVQDLQVSDNDGDGKRRRCSAGEKERQAGHEGRAVAAPIQHRRTTPIGECFVPGGAWGVFRCCLLADVSETRRGAFGPASRRDTVPSSW